MSKASLLNDIEAASKSVQAMLQRHHIREPQRDHLARALVHLTEAWLIESGHAVRTADEVALSLVNFKTLPMELLAKTRWALAGAVKQTPTRKVIEAREEMK